MAPSSAGPGGSARRSERPIDDAYGNPTVREVSSLRGLVKPGNSGGPMVDAAGQVIGTVFAEITNGHRDSRAGSRSRTVSSLMSWRWRGHGTAR